MHQERGSQAVDVYKVFPGTYRESTADCGSRSSFLYAIANLISITAVGPPAYRLSLIMSDNKKDAATSQVSIDLMKEALEKVSPYYVRSYEYIHGDAEPAIYDQVERCFAYELYHQLRQLSENDGRLGAGIVINAEIPKQGFPIPESSSKTHKLVFPDIVIHGGQECKCDDKQLLVCEIKRNSYEGKIITTNQAIKDDLIKLGWYVKCLQYDNHGIGFNDACFIMTNISIEDLRNKIKEIVADGITFIGDGGMIHNIEEVADKITIFSYNQGENNKPMVDKFVLTEVLP